MSDSAQTETRTLRRLAEVAWNAELGHCLDHLQVAFEEWKRGEISSLQLSNRIHTFHEGDARELYKTYATLPAYSAVARAVAHGYLKPADIPQDILAKLTPAILASYSMNALPFTCPSVFDWLFYPESLIVLRADTAGTRHDLEIIGTARGLASLATALLWLSSLCLDHDFISISGLPFAMVDGPIEGVPRVVGS